MSNFKLGKGTGDLYTFNGTFEGTKFSGVLKDGMFGYDVTHLTFGKQKWNKYENGELSLDLEFVRKYVLKNVRKFGGAR